MLSVRLNTDLERRLEHLSKETHRSKSYYVEQALREFLEDREDMLLALAVYERIKSGKEKTYSFEEVQKILGLENDDETSLEN